MISNREEPGLCAVATSGLIFRYFDNILPKLSPDRPFGVYLAYLRLPDHPASELVGLRCRK